VGSVVAVLPPALVRLFPGCEREPRVAAETVADLVDALNERWPGMRDRLCDPAPRLRRHINVFVNGERVGLDRRLHPGEEVWIMTAISGG
jgi:molybdopterin converting factor small subunit